MGIRERELIEHARAGRPARITAKGRDVREVADRVREEERMTVRLQEREGVATLEVRFVNVILYESERAQIICGAGTRPVILDLAPGGPSAADQLDRGLEISSVCFRGSERDATVSDAVVRSDGFEERNRS